MAGLAGALLRQLIFFDKFQLCYSHWTSVTGQLFRYNFQAMEIKELTHRMHSLVESKGWYSPESPKKQIPRNLAISLALEAAEVLEHFQWTSEVEDKEGLAGELADVSLYLLQLASICDIDLEAAILHKLETAAARKWKEHEAGGPLCS